MRVHLRTIFLTEIASEMIERRHNSHDVLILLKKILTVTREEEEGGQRWKQGEGTSQRTCMSGTWTWTAVWESTVGVGSGTDRGGQRGGNWDNSTRITVKK